MLTNPPQGKTFNLVSAQFEIPEPALPHNSNDEHYAAAFWVGLGGYSSQPLLQAGVDVVLTRSGNKTKILVEPWWEWFPDFSHLLTPLEFACEVGDIVSIAVYAASPLFGIITFNNLSTGQQKCLGVKSPEDQKYQLIGDSVEWIVEHFRIEGKWLPLPDYGTIKFSNCVAGAAEERMDLNDTTPIDSIGETSLNSYHIYSGPTIVNGSEFTVTYFPLK
ncbi:peptidase G1 [Halenospora varia]|nr:peptidase G1 [Halenospora varia]